MVGLFDNKANLRSFGIGLNYFTIRYSTPLHDAVCCGRQEVVSLLVDRGANINELDYKNMTPLKLAIR